MRRVDALSKTLAGVLAFVALLALAGAATAQAATALVARGSVEQVQVTGAKKGATVTLLGRTGQRVQTQKAGSLGGVVFRTVKPGRGYRVKTGGTTSAAVTVMTQRSAPPSTKGYDQAIPTEGYGYLTTRDGTKLAIDVHLPTGATPGGGPYPTLIEYSGYGYANPAGGQSSIAVAGTLMGFAVVDVNMRGTGCSGGAFDYFERLQSLDGYDVIETVARQPWVLHHKVGMMGLSYGGISQLFVGQTDPPSLAALAPLSVLDDSQTTLAPGGLLNTGFTVSWIKERDHDALPASATGGQAWALKRIQDGDATCKSNQDLHPEAVNLLKKVDANLFYDPKVADPLSPVTFVHKITVPTYLACQWTDEQTGGHCPTLAARFTGTERKWFTFTNGTHIDSLDPATITRWYDFLSLYVAKQAPRIPDFVRANASALFLGVMGIPDVTLPPDPIQDQPTYAAALAAFEQLPPIRVMFDNGAGGTAPGQPVAGFERSFSRFPIPGTQARSWYLAGGGALSDAPPARAGQSSFTWNPKARPATDFSGNTGAGGLWGATPDYRWTQNPAGTAVSYVTEPLKTDQVVIGAGALQTWIKASVPSADLQVTVSEVRPDGSETFVQSGWLRTSGRRLDAKRSTLLAPVLSLRKRDDAPLPKGRWAKVVVPLYYQGHAYRAGARLRVTVSAPGGDQPIWAFARLAPKTGTAKVSLAYSKAMPSRLILPVVAGQTVPSTSPFPPCPGLRGEPCRPYQALTNRR